MIGKFTADLDKKVSELYDPSRILDIFSGYGASSNITRQNTQVHAGQNCEATKLINI
ncbi:MAG: hypothetical protein LC115_02210 [Bacteroidia bacterium]|nr:hypothetical protein [Bacteroidia bacterium]